MRPKLPKPEKPDCDPEASNKQGSARGELTIGRNRARQSGCLTQTDGYPNYRRALIVGQAETI